MRWIAILIFLIVTIIVLFLIFYRPLVLFVERKSFKKILYLRLRKIAKYKDIMLLNNVALEIDGKIIHFNHLLLSHKFIYCIVGLNYNHALSLKDDGAFYVYDERGVAKSIADPLKLNDKRILYLSSYIKTSYTDFVSVCVVKDSCLIDNHINENKEVLINLKRLNNFIDEHEKINVNPLNIDMVESTAKLLHEKNLNDEQI